MTRANHNQNRLKLKVTIINKYIPQSDGLKGTTTLRNAYIPLAQDPPSDSEISPAPQQQIGSFLPYLAA